MFRVYALGLVVILALCSMIMVESSYAQTIPEPSVPQFTLTLDDLSYDVPLTSSTTTDPFTGQQTTTSQGGFHVTNRTITVKIKNQHFTPITLENGSTLQLYYAFRYKGHFGQDWTTIESSLMHSGVEYTEKTYVIATMYSHEDGDLIIPDNSQVDFQVQAIIGHYFYEGLFWQGFSVDRSSDWSNIQTLTIPAGVIPTVSPMPLPSVPEFPMSAVLCLLVALPLVVTVPMLKRRKLYE